MKIRLGFGMGAWPFAERNYNVFYDFVDNCESWGVDSLWFSDRIIGKGATLEPIVTIAALSGRKGMMKFGTNALIMPLRNPVIVAKELATLDSLTGGRVELGLGVGWLEEEFQALGVPWKRRGARNDEYVAAMKALWAGPNAEYHGEFVDFEPATCSPRPVNGTIPILVGGDTPAAIRRAARIADGYFPGTTDPETLSRLIEEVGVEAEKQGRAASDIRIHAIFADLGDLEGGAARMRDQGVERAMLPAFFFAGPGGLDRMQEFGERVVKPMAKS
jgi:probable F420-dependent oxidoreductase